MKRKAVMSVMLTGAMVFSMCAGFVAGAEEAPEAAEGEEFAGPEGEEEFDGPEGEEEFGGPEGEEDFGGEGGGMMGGGMMMSLSSGSTLTEEDLAVPMDNGPYSMDLSDYADQWEYVDHVDLMDKGEPTGESVDIDGVYVLSNVVYCTNPVHATEQCLTLFVPAAYMQENEDGTVSLNPEGSVSGVTTTGQEYTYTTETAPIYLINGVDGYRSAAAATDLGGNIKGQNEFYNYDYTNSGFIYATPCVRGSDSDAEYDGFVPSGLIDLKACVRFLKANDDVLAGDSDRIISVGGSAGGGMSALLGATGNSPDYEEALAAIGACDTSDDVYAAMCYCPITDLEYADALYEFLHYGEKGMTDWDGNSADIDADMQDALFETCIEYVQSLDLERDLGDDGRSGAFYEDYLGAFESSLAGYLATNYETAEEAQAYIDENVDPNGTGFVTYDPETGDITMTSIDDLTANYSSIDRAKDAPGFDTVDAGSNENVAFSIVGEDGEGVGQHFSTVTAEAFLSIGDEDTYNEYMADIDDDMLQRVYVMNPMNYIADEDSDNAPYWRFCSGSADGDLSSVSSWLMANYLESYGDVEDVQYLITWDKPHGTADYHITDQVAWVVSITAD